MLGIMLLSADDKVKQTSEIPDIFLIKTFRHWHLQ